MENMSVYGRSKMGDVYGERRDVSVYRRLEMCMGHVSVYRRLEMCLLN